MLLWLLQGQHFPYYIWVNILSIIHIFPLGQLPFPLAVSTDSTLWWAYLVSGIWKGRLTLPNLLFSGSLWFSNPAYHFLFELSRLWTAWFFQLSEREQINDQITWFFHLSFRKSMSHPFPWAFFMFIREAQGTRGF